MRTFEFSDGKSNKFWNIELSGTSFTVTYGRIGTAGQTQTKEFPSADKAKSAHDKLVAEKLGKGYVETKTGKSKARKPAAQSPREVLEKAIAENPDDLGAYAAYADCLIEQGDLRGEFIQVQLALEDPKKKGAERKKLQKRETDLLEKHEGEWLGDLAAYLLPGRPYNERRWERGFLARLMVDYLTLGVAQSLATAPAAGLLRELRITTEARNFPGFGMGSESTAPISPRVPTPRGVSEHHEFHELIGGGCLRNLRYFQFGDVEGEVPENGWSDCHTYAPGIEHVVAGMPRIEELHLLTKEYDVEHLFRLLNLTHLRILRIYHLGVKDGTGSERKRYEYPLDVLASNPALSNLTHLPFHPHHEEYHQEAYTGTQRSGRHASFLPLSQIEALLRSRHLARLTHLQLRLSDMGDDGIRVFIDSGILGRLKWLDLRHGCVTDAGARLLAGCAEARGLEHLDLSRNAVTKAGLSALTKAGIPARAEKPLSKSEMESQQYIFEGDGE